MSWPAIVKSASAWGPTAPNLRDYAEARARFSWAAARRELDGLPGRQGLNIAHEAVDRHAAGPRRDRVAIRWLGKAGAVRDYSYAELRDLTNRFANVLQTLGVGAGDRVYALAGRIPELYVAALGTLKNRSVFCPLFSAFGPEPIRVRMATGRARVLVTTASLYHRKVAALRGTLPSLEHVLLVDDGQRPRASPDTHDYHRADGRGERRVHHRARPTPRTSRCCTSPAAPRASRRGRSTSTRPSWPTTSRAGSPSIFTPRTSSGAPPIPGG